MNRSLLAGEEVPVAIEVTKLVWEAPLSRTEKLVLLALADHASADGTDVYPGTTRLARMTGLTHRTISKVRSAFVERGILLVDLPPTPASPGHYTINLEELRCLIEESRLTSPPERRSPPEPDSSPEPNSPPEPQGSGGVNQVPGGGEPRSSKPPIEPPREPPPGSGDARREDIEAEVEAEWERTPNKAEVLFPEKYKAAIRHRKETEHRGAAEQRKKNLQHQATVDECSLCNRDGWVLLEPEGGAPFADRCTHNRDDYSEYKIATASGEPGEAVA